MHCILHIGTEKTGTTTLQDWLYANRALLSQHRVYLCEQAGQPNNRLLAAYCQPEFDDFFRARGITDADAKREYFGDFEHRFGAELEAAAEEHDVLLLTSEHFSSRLRTEESIGHLRALLDPHVDRYTVVCYVREQSELIRSLYTTALIDGEVKALDAFHANPAVHDLFFNYDDMMGLWESVFGLENISLGVYGQDMLEQGDIRQDFIARQLPGLRALAFDDTASVRNQSIGRLQAPMLRLVNSFMNRSNPNNIEDDLRRRLVERVVARRHLAMGRMRLTRPQDIYDRFSASNARLFARYFGDDAPSFPAPTSVADEPVRLPDDFEEEFLDLLLSLFEDIRVETPAEAMLRLDNDAVEFFRDLAFKYETGEGLSRAEAVRLMKYARRGRPDGFYINHFLEVHANPDDPEVEDVPTGSIPAEGSASAAPGGDASDQPGKLERSAATG